MIIFKASRPLSTEPRFDRSIMVVNKSTKKVTYIKPGTNYYNRSEVDSNQARILLCQKDSAGITHVIYEKVEGELIDVLTKDYIPTTNKSTMAVQTFFSHYR